MRVFVLTGAAAVLCVAIAAAGATPDYSKESYVIQQFAKEVNFAADGTWTCEQSAVIRVQSASGARAWGVLAFNYDSDNQTIEIVYVRVRKPDGSLVTTPADRVQDVSSEVTREAPTYSDLRQKQVPVKALGEGDTLEYAVRFTQTKPEAPGQFWYAQRFLEGAVVLEEKLRITVPADKYVNIASPTVKPEIHEEGGRKIYAWKTARLEATSEKANEKSRPPEKTVPSVQVTTFKTWDEVGRWYAQLEADRVAITPTIQAKAAELTNGLATDADKQKAIYNYVATKFRYISLSFGAGRYQPHAASEVFANQYGDCKDKHTLFAALLKAAGMEAWAALIGAGTKLDPNVPSPGQFNHVITVVPKGSDRVWLDTTPEVAPYALLHDSLRGQQALVIPSSGPATLMTTPEDPPFLSTEVMEAKATLAANGTLKGHFDLTSSGEDEFVLRSAFHETPPAKWQDIVQAMMQLFGFAGTVSNVDLGNPDELGTPFHLSFDYTRENYSDWANRRILPLLLPMSIPFSDDQEKPSEPIAFAAPGKMTYRATIQLPKEFSAEIPDTTTLHTDFADYHAAYGVANGVLTATRELTAKKSKIPLQDWEECRKFAKQFASDQSQFIQLAATESGQTTTAAGNAQAQSLIQQAIRSTRSGELSAAEDALAQALRLNPKQRGLWAAYAALYFARNDDKKAFDDIHKEIEIHPENVAMYRWLAAMQAERGERDQAVETLRELLKKTPNDPDGTVQLAYLLIAAKRYKEVPDLVRGAIEKTPDNRRLQLSLAEALLRDGLKEEGTEAVQKYVKDTSDGRELNSAAWILADTDTDLTLAKQYSEKSVATLEGNLKQVTLTDLSNDDLRGVAELAAAWDTLGWVYFEVGDNVRAEKYLSAAWRLSQHAVIADHLGQLYAKEGKRDEAIHNWQLALAANNKLDEVRERLVKIGYSAPADTAKGQGVVRIATPSTYGEELSKLRTISIPELPKQEGSAEFFILLSAHKVEDAQFISGSDGLKSATAALMKGDFAASFPDDGPERIARRGILSCSTDTKPSCSFVLLLPSTTRK